MSARITPAGLSSMAKAQAEKRPWVHKNYILAYVPGLNFEQEIPENWLLDERQIIHESPITREGFTGDNQVIYSLFLGADKGDFKWNVEALRDEHGNITAVSWLPLTEKRKNREGLSGNVLARNFIQQYNAAKTLTGITIPAESWQFDISPTLSDLKQGKADKVLSGNVLEAGRANNVLIRHGFKSHATRMHIEPNGHISGTASKLDLMHDPYEDDPHNYRILNLYCQNGEEHSRGESGASFINVKSVGDHWGVFPSLNFGFQDGRAVAAKMYLFDTSDTEWRTPMKGIWREGLIVNAGDHVTANHKLYQAKNSGECGTEKPDHNGIKSDGNIEWEMIRDFEQSSSSIKPTFLFGDIKDMPLFGHPDVVVQFFKSVLLNYGSAIKMMGINGNTAAKIHTSYSSGQDFFNLDILGDGSTEFRFSSDGYYQTIGLGRRLTPIVAEKNAQVIDVRKTEIITVDNDKATEITKINGLPHQVIKIMSVNSLTVLKHNSSIRLKVKEDLQLTADDCIQLVSDGNLKWRQV